MQNTSSKNFIFSGIAKIAVALCVTASLPVFAQTWSADDLARRTVERRAVEAVIWGMPAVNFQLMLQAFQSVQGAPNQVAYWSRPLDSKNQTLTPNPDTIYLMPFYDTRNGPVVLEIPPAGDGSITGSIDDAWQNALEDVGPAGLDKGHGGKYLILPPDYKDQVPAGYWPVHSDTNQGYAILRSNLKSGSDADIALAVTYGKRIKFYPLSEARRNAGGQTVFVDAFGKMFDANIPYDSRFFDILNSFVQAEPWLTRDKVMIDMLKSLGINKGEQFAPDAATRTLFNSAAREAHASIDVAYEKVFVPPFNEGAHWALPASKEVAEGMPNFFANPQSYPVDGRAITYSMAYFSAKTIGVGQFYLMSIKDKDGNRLDGSKNYRLNVPANAPVRLYWSATVYDGATHALIRNARWASRSSNTQGLQKNPDGSVDIYFAPAAPAGNESNWVPTDPGGRFEVLFRLYGPEKPFFDKTWKLPDIETAS
jgi:hypothetical protein